MLPFAKLVKFQQNRNNVICIIKIIIPSQGGDNIPSKTHPQRGLGHKHNVPVAQSHPIPSNPIQNHPNPSNPIQNHPIQTPSKTHPNSIQPHPTPPLPKPSIAAVPPEGIPQPQESPPAGKTPGIPPQPPRAVSKLSPKRGNHRWGFPGGVSAPPGVEPQQRGHPQPGSRILCDPRSPRGCCGHGEQQQQMGPGLRGCSEPAA